MLLHGSVNEFSSPGSAGQLKMTLPSGWALKYLAQSFCDAKKILQINDRTTHCGAAFLCLWSNNDSKAFLMTTKDKLNTGLTLGNSM
jgi:hypothetical protein